MVTAPGELSKAELVPSVNEAWRGDPALDLPRGLGAADRVLSPTPNRIYGRNNTIAIAIIDEYAFTRESIARSLRDVCNILETFPFATSAECLSSGIQLDVIMYHAHPDIAARDDNDARLSCIKDLLPMAPVVVLCDFDSFDLIQAAFDYGVRGFIPTESTNLEVAIEIMYLVKAGGTFVPPSSLLRQQTRLAAIEHSAASQRFTPRQLEVLNRLKLGQTNKHIAFGLKMSESSVKTHIQNIMRKLGATNRTQVACLVQRLDASEIAEIGAAGS